MHSIYQKGSSWIQIIFIILIILILSIILFFTFYFNKTSLKSKEITKKVLDEQFFSQLDVSKFYYLIIEENNLHFYTLSSSENFIYDPVLDNVTIMKYDTKSKNNSVVISFFTSSVNGLELPYKPIIASSLSMDKLIFVHGGLFSFSLDKKFIIFAPNSQIYNISGNIQTIDLSAPVFSPDEDKVAYYTSYTTDVNYTNSLFDKENQIRQIRSYNLKNGDDFPIIENLSVIKSKKSESFWGYVIYPVRWYKDNEGEKLLLEQRNINENSHPIVTPGFWIYNFNTKVIEPVTFYYDKDKPITDCPDGPDYWACEHAPFYEGKSWNNQYLLFDYDYTYKNNILPYLLTLDISQLERSKNTESATTKLPRCGLNQNSDYIWSPDNKRIICSGFDENIELSKYLKSGTLSIPYKYNAIDIETGKIFTLHEDIINYKLKPEEEKVLRQYDRINRVPEEVNSMSKPVVGWIGESAFILKQSGGYDENDTFHERPTLQKIFLSDLKGGEMLIDEHKVDAVNKNVIEKMTGLGVNEKDIQKIKENIAKGQKYEIGSNIKVKFLGMIR